LKRSFVIACATLPIATGVACAASEDGDPSIAPHSPSVVEAADAATREAAVDADAAPPTCSPAGWCITSLPDADLVMKDIWPVPGHAFALAESPTLGVRVLEWEDTSATWKYIDDNTQNEPGYGQYLGRIWSPGENEIYFGIAPGTIYHGVRAQPPATGWSWTRDRLPDNGTNVEDGYPIYRNLTSIGETQLFELSSRYPALGVWGTSSDDVYAWYADTIYHWVSDDGGAPSWVAEYVAADRDDPSERLYVLGAAGTNRDDVWFSIARESYSIFTELSSCAILMRKTPAGYDRIADGVISANTCRDKAGFLRLGDGGWLTDLQAVAGNRFVGLRGARDVVEISVEGDTYSVTVAPVPAKAADVPFSSLWAAPEEQVWLAGRSVVVRGADVGDGGAYQISTTSLNGGVLNKPAYERPLYHVRGTSNTDLWVIGDRYALHKTTP